MQCLLDQKPFQSIGRGIDNHFRKDPLFSDSLDWFEPWVGCRRVFWELWHQG